MKQIHEQEFGLSGCLFVTKLRPVAFPHVGSGTNLGMKGTQSWPVLWQWSLAGFTSQAQGAVLQWQLLEYMAFPDLWVQKTWAQKAGLCS